MSSPDDDLHTKPALVLFFYFILFSLHISSLNMSVHLPQTHLLPCTSTHTHMHTHTTSSMNFLFVPSSLQHTHTHTFLTFSFNHHLGFFISTQSPLVKKHNSLPPLIHIDQTIPGETSPLPSSTLPPFPPCFLSHHAMFTLAFIILWLTCIPASVSCECVNQFVVMMCLLLAH